MMEVITMPLTLTAFALGISFFAYSSGVYRAKSEIQKAKKKYYRLLENPDAYQHARHSYLINQKG